VKVPDDSIGAMIGIDSRLLWRDITLADALGLQSGISFPVRFPRLPLQLEVDSWTALAKRSMQLMAEQVMPRVNAAIGKSASAAAE